MSGVDQLRVLQDNIRYRCETTAAQFPDWPCRRGCDDCCRSLAHPPSCTQAEWDLVTSALLSLPAVQLVSIDNAIRELLARSEPPYACPFLHVESGSCTIYNSRPIACRTYGFYTDRDAGLYCKRIERGVDASDFANVTWGNQVSIDADLDRIGRRIPLREWYSSTGIILAR